MSTASPYILAPGARLQDLNGLALKAGTNETNGAVAVYEGGLPARTPGPPLHVHEREDEALYVLEGEVTVRLGDELSTAGAGSFVWMPRGVAHSFANRGTVPVRLLGFAVPGGIEGLLASVPRDGSRLDPAFLAALADTYGSRVVGPPILPDGPARAS
jgi:mannose-6-phosphate isomerase-like protein (cupin superfamily)